MNFRYYPNFYEIQDRHLIRVNQPADNFWITFLKSSGIFFMITLIVFFIVNQQYLRAQFSDYLRAKKGENYNNYFNDSDNNDALDWWDEEKNKNLLNNIYQSDKDSDGLWDSAEYFFGTNENSADTDGDSYDDFYELIRGYSPLNNEKIFVQMTIPAINIKLPVLWMESLEGDDLTSSFNEKIIHYPGMSFPGLPGNALFIDQKSYNSKDINSGAWSKIDKIKKGDEIILEIKLGGEKIKKIIYQMEYAKVVADNDPLLFRDYEGVEMTLATNQKDGLEEKKYIIKAYLKEPIGIFIN